MSYQIISEINTFFKDYMTIILILGFLMIFILKVLEEVNEQQYIPTNAFYYMLGTTFVALSLQPALISYEKSIIRDESLLMLESIESKNNIYLNDKLVLEPKELLKALKKVKNILAHNSYTTKHKFVVLIKHENNKTKFLLEQDSERQHEYWVWTNYLSGEYNYIGRINTDIFDIYTKPRGTNFY